eukprot:6013490-Prymnesium_polylepis.1
MGNVSHTTNNHYPGAAADEAAAPPRTPGQVAAQVMSPQCNHIERGHLSPNRVESHTLALIGNTWCVAGDFGNEPHLDLVDRL